MSSTAAGVVAESAEGPEARARLFVRPDPLRASQVERRLLRGVQRQGRFVEGIARDTEARRPQLRRGAGRRPGERIEVPAKVSNDETTKTKRTVALPRNTSAFDLIDQLEFDEAGLEPVKRDLFLRNLHFHRA